MDGILFHLRPSSERLSCTLYSCLTAFSASQCELRSLMIPNSEAFEIWGSKYWPIRSTASEMILAKSANHLSYNNKQNNEQHRISNEGQTTFPHNSSLHCVLCRAQLLLAQSYLPAYAQEALEESKAVRGIAQEAHWRWNSTPTDVHSRILRHNRTPIYIAIRSDNQRNRKQRQHRRTTSTLNRLRWDRVLSKRQNTPGKWSTNPCRSRRQNSNSKIQE